MVFLPKFDERLFLSTIPQFNVTSTILVPPLMVFLSKHPMVDEFDLSSLKEIICGAAPMGKKIEMEVQRRLQGVESVRQGYGLTEAMNLLYPRIKHKPGSVGVISAGTSVKVVDPETRAVLGPNEKGELCFSGNQIMLGYLNHPEATRETFDEEGFIKTGDIGYYDEDGEFFIVDRLKELIKYNGYQVPPAEIEALLLTHPKIKDAAVVGMPDVQCGELPVAFVVKQDNADLTEKDSSPSKKLRGGVRFVCEIPKNPSGKILRRLLRASLDTLVA